MKGHSPRRPANPGGMTRRDFLQQLGFVGGSTMVMGAMTTLDLMGAPAGPRPRWSGQVSDARVLVLGAGVSGLTVGYELGKLGYEVRILEARDRVGGVSHSVRRGYTETDLDGATQTCSFADGHYLNAGPWRIPHVHTAVLDYCKELGVPLEIFVNETDWSYLYYEGEAFGSLSGKRVRLREVKADLRGHTTEMLAKALSQADLEVPLSVDDKERLITYLTSEGYLATPDLVYRGSGARGPGDPYDLSPLLQDQFRNRVRSIDSGQTRAPVFQPVGGMDQLPIAFARAMPDRITMRAAVREIRQTEDEVRVVYAETDTGTLREVTADYVVSCIPLSILSQVDANLSPEMMEAVRNTTYSGSAKIGLQMRRRFWEEDDGIYGGPTYTNLPLGQFAFPSSGYNTHNGVVLGFYGNGATAGLRDMSNADRLEHVLANGSKIHPQLREEYENGYCVFWEKVPYSDGAIAAGSGGPDGPARVERLRTADNRFYVGCSAVAVVSSPGWMEGTISGAWNTVDSLHSRVMGGA
jgi:monoamine oxidase